MSAKDFSATPAVEQHKSDANGHLVRYDFLVYNVASLEDEWAYMQDYQTSCEVFPTSWKFQMTFDRILNSPLVNGTAILKRNDSINVAVRAHLLVKFHHDSFNDYFPMRNVEKLILPGDEIRVILRNIVPDGYHDLLHEELTVTVGIYIEYCHLNFRRIHHTPVGDGAKKKKLHFSKL